MNTIIEPSKIIYKYRKSMFIKSSLILTAIIAIVVGSKIALASNQPKVDSITTKIRQLNDAKTQLVLERKNARDSKQLLIDHNGTGGTLYVTVQIRGEGVSMDYSLDYTGWNEIAAKVVNYPINNLSTRIDEIDSEIESWELSGLNYLK